MHFQISLPLWELLEISLKTKRWLYVIIISRACFRVDLPLTECQRTPCWKQARSLTDSYRIQNLAKWLRVHLPTKWFWVRIPLLSHNKHEKTFRSTAGIIFWSIELYFFSILSNILILLSWTEKNNTLEALMGLVFLMFIRYCFVNLF